MKTILKNIGWVMWAATIRFESPVSARIEAARAARYQRFSVGAPDSRHPELPPSEIGRPRATPGWTG